MSLGAVERVEARGEAALFVTGQAGNAGAGGGHLRILLPFFSDRLVRRASERLEYLIDMPHRFFSAARTHGGYGQPAEKLSLHMGGKLIDDRLLRFPKLLIGVIGLRPRRCAIFLRQPVGEDGVCASRDSGDPEIVRAGLSGLREKSE